MTLPAWAQELQLQYESDAVAQFILHGNVDDRHLLPLAAGAELGSLTDFLLKVLLPRFDVVITYDVGNGLRVERGSEALKNWPRFQEKPDLPREPRAAVDWLSHFMRWCVNVARLGQRRWQVAVIVRSADLLVPAGAGWAGLAACVFSCLAIAVLKSIWSRPRPLLALFDVRIVGDPLFTNGFPSGHTLTAWAVAVACGAFIPRLRFLLPEIANLLRLRNQYLYQRMQRYDYPQQRVAHSFAPVGSTAPISRTTTCEFHASAPVVPCQLLIGRLSPPFTRGWGEPPYHQTPLRGYWPARRGTCRPLGGQAARPVLARRRAA